MGSIPANSDAQNVPSFRRWRFEMKLVPLYLYVPVHTKFDLDLLHMVFFSLWTPGYVVLYMGSTYIHLATSKHCSQIEKPSIHLYGIYWYIPCFDNAILVHTSTYWYIPKRLMMYFLILVHTGMYQYVPVCTKTSVLVQV